MLPLRVLFYATAGKVRPAASAGKSADCCQHVAPGQRRGCMQGVGANFAKIFQVATGTGESMPSG